MPENNKRCPKCLGQAANGQPQYGMTPQYGRGLPTAPGPYGFPNTPPARGGSLIPPVPPSPYGGFPEGSGGSCSPSMGSSFQFTQPPPPMGNMYQQHGPPPPQSMQPGGMNHPAMGFPNYQMSQGSAFGQVNHSISRGYGSPSGMQNDNQWALYVLGGLFLWIAILLLK
ncbi:hypothetical protein PGTUg99_029874 [Puccinia graminis f. sp. tritici]|uniref:Uncharacterized protein n=1 Tax=Puccinia graminis f. sp. tritici TaxID=56615 RepID=A0A5B0P3P7_PUCGR|nr:hypothetical protein PGTUg99_029874 [Puccinia graminis f. sp. tritici]